MTSATDTVHARITSIRTRIEHAATVAKRDPATVTIVGVSKTVGWPEITAAYEAGLRHFGENRVQDARNRIPTDHPDDFILHMIGQLQTNKVGQALDLFDIFESLDRPSLVAELQKQAAKRERIVPVLLQVNIAGEDQKAGCAIDDVPQLASIITQAPNLRLDGFMTMAPLVDDPEDVRFVFQGLRALRDRIAAGLQLSLPMLSMGMTNDFSIAVEEGATHVRIGRALFNP